MELRKCVHFDCETLDKLEHSLVLAAQFERNFQMTLREEVENKTEHEQFITVRGDFRFHVFSHFFLQYHPENLFTH